MVNFQKILCRNILNPKVFPRVMPILEAKYFTEVGAYDFFGIVKEYYAKYDKVPNLTDLSLMVRTVPHQEVRKQLSEFIEALEGMALSDHEDSICEETVAFVKDALYMEALMLGSDGLSKNDDNLKRKAEAILEKRAKITLQSDFGTDFNNIDVMLEYFAQREIGVKSTHRELNKRIGQGFLPGTLSVIAAAQGVGKSLFMCDLAAGMLANHKNVLMITLEMSEKEMMKRIYANLLDVDINKFPDLSMTEGEKNSLGRPALDKEQVQIAFDRLKTSGKLGSLIVKEFPTGTFSAMQLEGFVERYEQETGRKFDVIFVDYLGIAASDKVSQAAGLYSYVKSITEEFRAVAVKLKVPVISASQLNRASINEIEGVDNSNLSDSLGIAMTADFCMLLLQDEESKANATMTIKVTKNRFTGRTDTWVMHIDYAHMRFKDANENVSNVDFSLTNGANAGNAGVSSFSSGFGGFGGFGSLPSAPNPLASLAKPGGAPSAPSAPSTPVSSPVSSPVTFFD